MFRILYSILFYLAVPAILARLYWRSRRQPRLRQRLGERFARPRPAAADARPRLLIHAVSVGEVMAAAPLIAALAERYPNYPMHLTTMTLTGSDQVRALFGDGVDHSYLPYDLPGAMERFLAAVNPMLVVVMETELWPNLLHCAKARGIPTLVANARMSARSARRYGRFRHATRALLATLDAVAAQSRADARRFAALGMPPAGIAVTGSLKYHVRPGPCPPLAAPMVTAVTASGRPVLLAASTRAGEEAIVLDAFARLAAQHGQCLLVLVPRHPERFDEVARLCAQRGFETVRRSAGAELPATARILLWDAMGEMAACYALAQVAFVGGSLVDRGCQNVLEPAAWSLPILTGPSQYNFAQACRDLQRAGALRVVTSAEQLATEALALLEDANRREVMGAAAARVIVESQAALPAVMGLVDKLLAK